VRNFVVPRELGNEGASISGGPEGLEEARLPVVDRKFAARMTEHQLPLGGSESTTGSGREAVETANGGGEGEESLQGV